MRSFSAIAMAVLFWVLTVVPSYTQEIRQQTVLEVMIDMVVPASAALWGAYEVQTEQQWLELETAASALVTAGEMLSKGGAGPTDVANAANADWQQYNQQMVEAARKMLSAIRERDEAALSTAGNDELYPPCESCHSKYMTKK